MKWGRLANFAPADIPALDEWAVEYLMDLKFVGLTQCNWVYRRIDDSKPKTRRITKTRKYESTK